MTPILRVALPALAGFTAAGLCAPTQEAPADCSGASGRHTEGITATAMPVEWSAPAPGDAVRVGGDLTAAVTGSDGGFRSGPCRIETPLPLGYPAPTPPGAVDIKTYPAVRLAEVAGSGSPDRGMDRAFWPLFNHIKKHGIAMTSPVEMRYEGLAGQSGPESWSMAFLYRTPDLNGPGVEGVVTVRDAQPVTVVAAGLRGDYSMALVERGMQRIEEWLAANPRWEPAGDWRSLYYNGPTLTFWNKWAEVQLPVRPVEPSVEAGVPALEGPAVGAAAGAAH